MNNIMKLNRKRLKIAEVIRKLTFLVKYCLNPIFSEITLYICVICLCVLFHFTDFISKAIENILHVVF